MAVPDSRAIVVSLATLALVGCCLFVLHAGETTSKFEAIKLEFLSKDLEAAIVAAGQAAKVPKDFNSVTVPVDESKIDMTDFVPHVDSSSGGGATEPQSIQSVMTDAQIAAAVAPYLPQSRLQRNCLALKAFAYTIVDDFNDVSNKFKVFGVVSDLLTALMPTDKPDKKHSTPLECVAEYWNFVDATKNSNYTRADSLPLKMLKSITIAMEEGKGLLQVVRRKNAKFTTLNTDVIGLDGQPFDDIKGIYAPRNKVALMIKNLKDLSLSNVLGNALSKIEKVADAIQDGDQGAIQDAEQAAQIDKEDVLPVKDQKDLAQWTGNR